ncbi:MAG: anaerobic dehydrogenase subunit [Candidatus Frackibacter sp. T328-2]|nr:MAG: anaerobic dehydrogenase subunit [Candidatus Frackibacter sp. T328-2]
MTSQFNEGLWKRRLHVLNKLKDIMLSNKDSIIHTRKLSSFLTSLSEYDDYHSNEFFDQCWSLLENNVQNNESLWKEILFDFNRLFVGPDKLQAPPYESVYRDEGLIMGPSTLEVRNFYQSEGLKLENQGKEPDDHIGIELEFLSYITRLIIMSQEKQAEEEVNYYQELYEKFLNEHLLQWGLEFADLIIDKAETKFMKGVGLYLKGFLKEEELQVNS